MSSSGKLCTYQTEPFHLPSHVSAMGGDMTHRQPAVVLHRNSRPHQGLLADGSDDATVGQGRTSVYSRPEADGEGRVRRHAPCRDQSHGIDLSIVS